MIHKESPQNLYRLLTCRDIDLHTLEGMVLDHACLFDTYTMNRDARILENKKVLEFSTKKQKIKIKWEGRTYWLQ